MGYYYFTYFYYYKKFYWKSHKSRNNSWLERINGRYAIVTANTLLLVLKIRYTCRRRKKFSNKKCFSWKYVPGNNNFYYKIFLRVLISNHCTQAQVSRARAHTFNRPYPLKSAPPLPPSLHPVARLAHRIKDWIFRVFTARRERCANSLRGINFRGWWWAARGREIAEVELSNHYADKSRLQLRVRVVGLIFAGGLRSLMGVLNARGCFVWRIVVWAVCDDWLRRDTIDVEKVSRHLEGFSLFFAPRVILCYSSGMLSWCVRTSIQLEV